MVMSDKQKSSFMMVSLVTLCFMFTIFSAIGLFISSQHEHHLEVTKTLAKGHMEVISIIAQEELQKGNYDSLGYLFAQWAAQYTEIDEVKLMSNNGFQIADYGPLNPSERRYIQVRKITYSYRGQATLTFAYSLEHAYAMTYELLLQMFAAGLSVSLVFSLLTYQFVSRRREARLLSGLVDELRDVETKNRHLAAYPKANPNPIAAYDLNGNEIFCNPAFSKLIEQLHVNDRGIVLPEDHAKRISSMQAGEDQLYAEVDVGEKHLLLHYQWIDLVKEVYVYIQDITALRFAEQALVDERNQARTTLSAIADAVITTDLRGRITYLNQAAGKVLNQDVDGILGERFETVFILLDEDRSTPIENPLLQCQLNSAESEYNLKAKLALSGGKVLNVDVTVTRIISKDEATSGIVIVIRDMTRERRLQEELYRQANHDNLTELMNRIAFETHLDQALESAHKRGREHVLCFMDLDQFKVVNDTCGHVAGDELLRQIATIMRCHFRGSDILARIGGDEFGAILTDCPLTMALARADALRKEVSEYAFTWEGHIFRVSISIGVVLIDRLSESATRLMSCVDAACYAAKDSGRNCINVYQRDSASTKHLLGQMQWVSQINNALEKGSFQLYAQPIVDLHSDELPILAIEILVRMESSAGDLIPPGAFLPSAERYDLIDRIDYWVIEQVMRQLSSSRGGYPDCFINISGMTLNRNDFSLILNKLLSKYDLSPGKLVFEVTETAAIQNLSYAIKMIHELRKIGCRFALDDFGSGLSSFGYLKNLPIDYLKIDGMFVRNMHTDPMDRGMVEAIKTVADTMQLTTIAEFVEDDLILKELKHIGIDLGQGYRIAKPKPIEAYLARQGSQSNVIWLEP